MKIVENPPDAASLMTSARSFGNYDLPGALADLIDNSIKAHAKQVSLSCAWRAGEPEIRVLDNGHGMSAAELRTAMRPASSHPLAERSPDDLGRFGWGLKSASFSQCKSLTVLSVRDGKLSGCVWDLDAVDGWAMGVLAAAEIRGMASPDLLKGDGTEVIWGKCDRLSEEGALSEAEFDALIVQARQELALIFHRYLAGEVRGRKLTLRLNGQKIEAWDPFHRDHEATQELEEEPLRIEGRSITIRSYILPHYSKLKPTQYEKLAGDEGLLRNQGFYVYRNHRLIISGTWFRLARHGELSQLVRVSIDIPNSLDHLWKITIDKSDAQLPAVLRNRLRQLVDGLRRRSAKVYRSKGGRLDRPGSVSVWSRHARGGEIRYSINREHPVIGALLEAGDEAAQQTADAALRIIEQGFPAVAFGADATAQPDAIHQTEADPQQFRRNLLIAVPALLEQAGDDLGRMVELLKITEPWSASWDLTAEILREKGWLRGAS